MTHDIPLNYSNASPGKVMVVDDAGKIAPASTLLADLALAAAVAAALTTEATARSAADALLLPLSGGTLTGALNLATGTFNKSDDGSERLYYAANGFTLFKVPNDASFYWQNRQGASIAELSSAGNLTLAQGSISAAGATFSGAVVVNGPNSQATFGRPSIGNYSEFIFATGGSRDWTLGTRANDSGWYLNKGAGATPTIYVSAGERVLIGGTTTDDGVNKLQVNGPIATYNGSSKMFGVDAGGGVSAAFSFAAPHIYTSTIHSSANYEINMPDAVNFGGSSGHSYFDASGDLRVRSGQTLNIGPDGYALISMPSGGIPNFPFGLLATAVNVQSGGIVSYGCPLYLTSNYYGPNPIVIGSSSTTLSGSNVIDIALPTVCRSTISTQGNLIYLGNGGFDNAHCIGRADVVFPAGTGGGKAQLPTGVNTPDGPAIKGYSGVALGNFTNGVGLIVGENVTAYRPAVLNEGASSPTGNLLFGGYANCAAYRVNNVAGASGSYTTADSKTVTVTGGIITAIA